MRSVEVDERDSSWENSTPRFRVYLFGPAGDTGYSLHVLTYDITDADALQAIDWAQRAAERLGGLRWSLALVGEHDGIEAVRGLTWLVGMDANDHPWDDDEEDTRRRQMTRIGDTKVIIPDQDRSPIDPDV